ncbi:putative quinol monooxygenase [Streptomyces sp. NPDC054813]
MGLLVRFEAKPDKVSEVEAALKSALDQVREETTTPVWVALRLGPTTFGIFDAFADEAGREAHLEAFGEALRVAGAQLGVVPPTMEYADVIGAKLPGA